MKKNFMFYSITWVVLLILFNIIAFVPVSALNEGKIEDSFWIGYALITITFIGNLVFSFIAFWVKNIKKVFLNLPLLAVSYFALISSFIFGGLCMAVPDIPYWVSILICCIVLAFYAISVVSAFAVSDNIGRIDQKIKNNSSFINNLTVDAESLVSSAKSEEVKKECKKVYEAIRYSDPMSSNDLYAIESQISEKMNELANAVSYDQINTVKELSANILILVQNRNQKCKVLK